MKTGKSIAKLTRGRIWANIPTSYLTHEVKPGVPTKSHKYFNYLHQTDDYYDDLNIRMFLIKRKQ